MVAVCGTGMGALALLFREAGVRITGSDVQSYPPMGELLSRAGVEVRLGYSRDNLPQDAQYVVIGNAVSRDNPEVAEVLARGILYGSMPVTLARFFLPGRSPVVVVGTHGKTTSTALLAWLLESAGRSPGFLVGGECKNFPVSSRLGTGPYFVLEGDEYDSAFFDKEPKFLHYLPQVALFTSLEYDHADIYPDLASLRVAFQRFVHLLPRNGRLMVCGEYPLALEVSREASCPVETYGFGEESDWRGILDLKEGHDPLLRVIHRGRTIGDFSLPLAGRHNALNALGCLGVLHRLGVDPQALREGLKGFKGVRRRQDVVAEVRGVLIVDDFAHHPTAVRETIRALRLRYPGRRLVAIFEPRTHTSRRNIFQREFAEAFAEADLSICTRVFREDSVEAENRFSPELWAEQLRSMGRQGMYFPETEELIEHLSMTCRSGDLLLFMSSASLYNIINELKRKLNN